MQGTSKADPAVRTSSVEFFKGKEGFEFICNRVLDGKPWTPEKLRRKFNVEDFANLSGVVCYVTFDNLEPLMEAVEAWSEANIRITMVFPAHRCRPRPVQKNQTCFGMPVGECYEPGVEGFVATPAFRQMIVEFFKDDRMVTVEV